MLVAIYLLFGVVQTLSYSAREKTEYRCLSHEAGAFSSSCFKESTMTGSSCSSSHNDWPYTKVKPKSPRQSPIDLITGLAVTCPLPPLSFIVPPDLANRTAKVYNSGRTVLVYMSEGRPEVGPQIFGGPLFENTFYFEHMHFHWGDEDIWGSEHFIDGESFSAEIHMVHWNSKYDNFTYASAQDDGLAVLAVFVEENNATDNMLLEPLYHLMANVSEASSYVNLNAAEALAWPLSALPDNSEFYTYPGSLTTPPYSENVVFILLPKPISLSNSQLEAFRRIHSSGGDKNVSDNKRKLQPLHNRPIVRGMDILGCC